MPKSWKESFCKECDFCITNACRKAKPDNGRYPTVVGAGSNKMNTPACSDFKQRPEKETVKGKK